MTDLIQRFEALVLENFLLRQRLQRLEDQAAELKREETLEEVRALKDNREDEDA